MTRRNLKRISSCVIGITITALPQSIIIGAVRDGETTVRTDRKSCTQCRRIIGGLRDWFYKVKIIERKNLHPRNLG